MYKNMFIKILCLTIFFITLSACHLSHPSKKQDIKAVPAFIDGLDKRNIYTCSKRIKNQCPSTEAPLDRHFTDCIETRMVEESTCAQNLPLFILERGFFDKIKHYNKVDVARVSIIASDEPIHYFMISHQGELIDPVKLLKRIDITKDHAYLSIARKFPQVSLWGIVLDFPKSQPLKNHQTRLIFRQKLLNGCRACAQAGIAEIAYDFDKKGQFLDATLSRLIPVDS